MSEVQSHAAFEWLRSNRVPSLNIEVQEFRHRATGALHYHLAADDDQNAFMVAFRTVPQDSTGVAHILEHTALCGSQRFPVRDPFFMMTRRSLNTFMNAFTASDWTAYPFASRNRKDYDNLLQVYLDAVFFPSLNELDFLQEGHRVEFAEEGNPNSELVFKGVVFNEMKGAMSSPVSTLWQTLGRELFPSITYHHNSGGDPERIPDLSYDELKAFHARHYHPSNAVIMSYGDLPAAEQQARFDELALNRFEAQDMDISVPDEQRFEAPRKVEDRYALDSGEDCADKSHIVLGWLLGKSTDIQAVLEGHLLSGVLLDNGASPLRRALETTELGSAPSPLCGLTDSNREMVFAAGIEGSNPESAEALEQLILDTLRDVAEQGVDTAMVEAVLHQLELHQREVGGDGFPFGMQLMVNALSPVLHGADAVEVLDIDPVLEHLRERIQDPDYIKGLARDLLDNRHRVLLTLRPDAGLSGEREAAESARLAAMKAAMDDAAKQRVIDQAAELAARQQSADDPELLPKVGLEDVPTELAIPEGDSDTSAGLSNTWFSRGTNGLFYQQLIVDLPPLDDELLELLPLYTDIITEVGSGGRDYLETQALQAAVTGGINAGVSQRSAIDRLDDGRALFSLSGKALSRNRDALSRLLQESFDSARLDELPRIRELVAQERMHQEQGVTQRGHGLAMSAAAAGMSRAASRSQMWHGLGGIKSLKALDDGLTGEAEVAALAEKFQAIQEALRRAPRQLLLIGEEEIRESALAAQQGLWSAGSGGAAQADAFSPSTIQQAWATSSQVNFCARAFPTVPLQHADAPALMVLGGFLRNNYLHRSIREQGGAYGGGAGYDSDSGAFRFYSYRDPRLGETLADFDASIAWMLENTHEWRLVEEALLGVIGNIDKPGSPAGEAKKSFHASLHGRSPEQRRALRARILEVREADLKRVTERYLSGDNASTAVIGSPDTLKGASDALGLELIAL